MHSKILLERSSQNIAQLLEKASVRSFFHSISVTGNSVKPFWDGRVFKQYIQRWHIPFTSSDFFHRRTGIQIFRLHNWFELVHHRIWKMKSVRETSGKQVGKNKKLWNYFHLGWLARFLWKTMNNFYFIPFESFSKLSWTTKTSLFCQ